MYSKDNPRSKDPSLFNIVTTEKIVIKGNTHQVLTKDKKYPNQKYWDSLSKKDLEYGRTKGHKISQDNRSRTKAIFSIPINICKDLGLKRNRITEALEISLDRVSHCKRVKFIKRGVCCTESSLYTGNPPLYPIFENLDTLKVAITFIKTGRHTMTTDQMTALHYLFTSIKIDGKTIWEHINPEGLCYEDISDRQSKGSKDDEKGWKVKETKILDESINPNFSAQVEITL